MAVLLDDVMSSEAPEYIPYGFQTPSQLLYLKHCQFFKLQAEYHLVLNQMDLLSSAHCIDRHTAIIATAMDSSALPFVSPSDDANCPSFALSLLSALMSNAVKLCNRDTFLLDQLDITEILNPVILQEQTRIMESGVIPDACDQDTTFLGYQLSSLFQNLDTPLEHVSRMFHSLIEIQGDYMVLRVSEISETLLRYLYWMDSSYLDAFLQTASAYV